MTRLDDARPDAPFVIAADTLPAASAANPSDAPPPPEEEPTGAAMQRVTRIAARKPSFARRWFLPILGSLLTLVLSVAAYDYITNLLVRVPWLGMVALVLTALLALIVLVQILREMLAFRKLARLDTFRKAAADVQRSQSRDAAVALSESLARFYAGRPDVAWGIERLTETRDDMLDADALLEQTERTLFAQLDAEARREIEAAARTVAGATALIPLALADVLAALSMNIRMIRRIAEIYGAHAGFFGSWRLLRTVATHLIATGAVAVGDDMISSVAGGGILCRVSRRFGEGVINGALTARVGIAAMEVCRPLPFDALPRPNVSNVMRRALTGMFPQKAD